MDRRADRHVQSNMPFIFEGGGILTVSKYRVVYHPSSTMSLMYRFRHLCRAVEISQIWVAVKGSRFQSIYRIHHQQSQNDLYNVMC